MNYEPTLPVKLFLLLAIMVLMGSTQSCKRASIEVPSSSDFNKEKRELLGELIRTSLLESGDFQILPKTSPPYDTSYWFLQTLYDQATQAMRLDNQSPSYNRWDESREWDVFIIQNDTLETAFSLPAGDFFISTGLLKALRQEYELYYFMAFEASLMNERKLLERIIQEYNSLTLTNLLNGDAPANSITLQIIREELPDLIFEESVIQDVDNFAVETICNSSIYEGTGVLPLLENDSLGFVKWLHTKPNYINRALLVAQLSIEFGLECGNVLTTQGNYQRYVLDILP